MPKVTENTFKQLAQKSDKNLPKIIPKRRPKAPQMTHGSSIMSPECPPPIGKTHFGDPPGSKMTLRGPKVTPGVPKVTPQGSPQALKTNPLDIQSRSWNLFGPHFRTFVRALCLQFRFLLPPRPFDPPTKQLLETRAGGMRGAI